ncbi:hypothetical protein E5Q_05142 [Mixia osmundae IAM 14324]|uniref:Pre-mRNA-splicing factor CWC26 n=1 Tax=Mixia osmundae (strain CBS 9802 / IAM 14324 / JCM 22182 / KY 12970) TaxID=764103 RepID=G7E6J6_MIXOS|nr:hypothetical protein E5Q_05142 [Mixia osmundae IAM 14324]
MSNLSHSAYLASKYLSGPKADAILAREGLNEDATKRKKRKKRRLDDPAPSAGESSTGWIVDQDDGDSAWTALQRQHEDDEEDRQHVVEHKTSKYNFKRIKPPKPKQEEAIAEDEQPVVAAITQDDRVVSRDVAPPPSALYRAVGGIQTDEQLAEAAARRRAVEERAEAEAREAARLAALADPDDETGGTVYRDKKGRRIDTKAERAAELRAKREKEEKEMAKMEWGKGLVQREDKEAKRREEERLLAKPMARYADDRDMNDELKQRERWNDPAARFLTSKTETSRKSTRPQYNGPAPAPNRFGIKPGYRWDGVDRGNGFEKKLLQQANLKKTQNAQAYAWSTYDM